MAVLKPMLEDLASGAVSVDFVRNAIDEGILSGTGDPQAMLAEIDAAVGAGLGASEAATLRDQVRRYLNEPDSAAGLSLPDDLSLDGAGAPAAPQAPAGDFMDLELISMDTPDSKPPPAAPAPPSDGGLTLEEPIPPPPSAEDKTIQVAAGAEDRTMRMDMGGDDRTVQMGGDDRTVQMGGGDDRTVQMGGGGEDRTVQTGGSGGEYDPFALDSQPTGQGHTGQGHTGQTTGGSWPTGTAWPGAAGGKPLEIGPGAILKDRFELVSPLGEGGMGVVYKARDLLKVEAKDRNPYVAVKLLTGDFKSHPESFIALQRESSKAQRLAHPNIATVFDFDRDRGTVYMTMEVMDGQELAKYIKKLPPGGLPVEEALRITKQMCDGLGYAHQRGLVHSDFKPGNCFILDDGAVKIMDFGIARASKTKADAAGETTVFDPGQLGALTPAYATVEMFEGEDPAPPDDIYALAVTTYELLTGKHPFNKLSAVKVLEKGLSPAPIVKPGWTKRQNKGLMRALALKRADRTQTVEQFWEDIRPKKDYTLQIVGGSVAAIVLLGAGLWGPVTTFLEDKRNAQIIANVVQGDESAIPPALEQISTLDDRSKRAILDHTEARDKFLAYFVNQAQAEIDPATSKFNYAKALQILTQADRDFYPDSAFLQTERRRISDDQASLEASVFDKIRGIQELTDPAARRAGYIPSEQNPEDMLDLLATLKAVKPDHAALVADARIPDAYAAYVQQFSNAGQWQQADDLLKAVGSFYPTHAGLAGLRDQVSRELKRQADNTLVAEIKGRLANVRGSMRTLDDYAAAREDLVRLNQLRPEDPLGNELGDALRTTLDATVTEHIAAKRYAEAEAALFDYAQLQTVPDLLRQREALSRAEIADSYQPEDLAQKINRLDERQKDMRALLAKPTFEAEWDAQLLGEFKETIALLRPGNTWFDGLRKEIVDAYLAQATKATTESRFDTALRLLATGERFQPGLARFEQDRAAIAQARERYEAEQAEATRLAKINSDQTALVAQANAKNVARASALFNELRNQLGADNAWLRGEGSQAMARMYLTIAQENEKTNAGAALSAVRNGLQYAPDDRELQGLAQSLQGASARADAVDFAGAATSGNVRQLTNLVNAARQAAPRDANAIQTDVLTALARRIKAIEQSGDVNEANDLWSAAKELFPNASQLTSLTLKAREGPSQFAGGIRTAMTANKLTEAQNLLNQGKQREPGHSSLVALEPELKRAMDGARQAYQQYLATARTDKNAAKSYLDTAIRQWADNEEYIAERDRSYKVTKAVARAADGSKPCPASVAGYGRLGRAECFDMIGTQRATTLVVVPAGGGFAQPFAIGKFEVSVAEYNAVCRASSRCPPANGDASLPVTGVSLDSIRSYLAALNELTGKSYRLPTEQEWVYAATSTNANAVANYNCRVQQGDQIIKGLALEIARTGQGNPWGLTNFIGNAQELVTQGGGVVARGGAFSDSLSSCGIALSKPSNGAADPTTGFRLVRDID